MDSLFLLQIPKGSIINSINGVSSEKIIAEIKNQISYETNAFFNTRFKDLFSSLLYCKFDFKENFKVEYLFDSKLKTVLIKNESFKINSNNSQKEEFSFSINDNFAFLTINSFGVSNEDEYFLFLKKSFEKIKKEGIEKLIIDVRLNDGGNSVLGDSLLAYISKVPFKQYGTTFYKYSKIEKELNIRMNKDDTAFIGKLNKMPNGFIEKRQGGELIKPLGSEKQFNGKVYLLISNFTFSAAADFAWAFKHYKLGKIVGQETGGLGVCFGDGVQFILPNSKISGQSSCQKFYNIGASDNDFNGVVPDIITEENEELGAIVNLLKVK